MFKFLSIAAVAMGVLLAALPGGKGMPVKLSESSAAATCFPQRKHVALAGEFHARLFVYASRSLDAAVKQAYGDTGGEKCMVSAQELSRERVQSVR